MAKTIGRPKQDITKVRLNVRCTDKQKEYLKELGKGSVQKGIDIVLEKSIGGK